MIKSASGDAELRCVSLMENTLHPCIGYIPWSEADFLEEEEQVGEPAGGGDVVEHVADAVGQHRPPPEGLGDGQLLAITLVVVSHGGSVQSSGRRWSVNLLHAGF